MNPTFSRAGVTARQRRALRVTCASISATLWVCLAPALVHAQSAGSGLGFYAQAGGGAHGHRSTSAATLGLVAPWSMQRDFWNGQVSGYWDLFASRWSAEALSGGRDEYTQIGIIPTVRWRSDGGLSPWFADAGLGLSYLDRIYATPERVFSTRFNFTEVLAVGRSFGDQGQHELALRLQHFSNAGIRQPNPGENFVQLRYTVRF